MSSLNCSSGCPTQDHATYGECMRSKGLKIAYCQSTNGSDATRQKKWDAELDSYRAAVAQGIQPETTKTRDIRAAVEWSNNHGVAYSDETARAVKLERAIEKVA